MQEPSLSPMIYKALTSPSNLSEVDSGVSVPDCSSLKEVQVVPFSFPFLFICDILKCSKMHEGKGLSNCQYL